MRKAEEWILFLSNLDNQININVVKTIQEEAIRETAQECANLAQTKTKFKNTGDYSGYSYDTVDKNSILSIADKLIKEL